MLSLFVFVLIYLDTLNIAKKLCVEGLLRVVSTPGDLDILERRIFGICCEAITEKKKKKHTHALRRLCGEASLAKCNDLFISSKSKRNSLFHFHYRVQVYLFDRRSSPSGLHFYSHVFLIPYTATLSSKQTLNVKVLDKDAYYAQ